MVCEQDCLSIHTHMHAYIYTHPICSVWWTVYAFFFQGSCQWYTNLSPHSLHLYSCFVTHTVCVCASMSMPSRSSFVDLTCSQCLVRNPCSSLLSVAVHLHGHGEEAEFEPVSFAQAGSYDQTTSASVLHCEHSQAWAAYTLFRPK